MGCVHHQNKTGKPIQAQPEYRLWSEHILGGKQGFWSQEAHFCSRMRYHAIAYCGFSEVLVHLNMQNVHQLRHFNTDGPGMAHPSMRVQEAHWTRHRTRLRKSIKDK